MPAYTFQIALKEDDDSPWLREYVCAEDKYQAVYQFIEDHPPLTLEYLLLFDEFHVEACA